MKSIKPANKVLFCQPDEPETKTASGILLDLNKAEQPKIATVKAIGRDVEYSVGDRIVYKSYSTSDIKLDGVEYFLISDEDVLGTVVEG